MVIAVIRIAGQVKNKATDNETMKRLKLARKFNCVLINEDDAVRVGMVRAVRNCVSYGKIDDKLVKEMDLKRVAKEGVYSLHPPIGGLKKSSRLPCPKGVLGENKDIGKLLVRML